jgi:hypothetical protein
MSEKGNVPVSYSTIPMGSDTYSDRSHKEVPQVAPQQMSQHLETEYEDHLL